MAYNMTDMNYAWDKAQQLNSQQNYTGYNPGNVGAGQWGAQEVLDAFSSAGLTPEQHYSQYGKDEGLAWGDSYATVEHDIKPKEISTAGNFGYGTTGGGFGANNTTASIPSNTVTVPEYALNNQEKMSANIPEYFEQMMELGLGSYGDAYKNLAALPGKIDDWTAESLKRQRVTGDQATGVFNQVANQRAGGGIQGGTEAQNLESNAQARLSQIILENQNNIQNQANQLKAGTIQNMPSVASMPISNALSLYGTSANEALSWGNMAMNTLLSSY